MIEPVTLALRELVASINGRISPEKQYDVTDYIDHREWGLAVDILYDALFDADVTLSPDEAKAFEHIVLSIGEDPADYSFALASLRAGPESR